jgi:hypothetical protein
MKLKAQNNNRRTPTPTQDHMPTHQVAHESYNPGRTYVGEEEETSDVEMVGSEAPSPKYTKAPAADQLQLSTSPALLPQDSYQRHESYSSTSASVTQRHYSYNGSSMTPPAFGSQAYEYAVSNTSANSTLTSPALLPQRDRDLDQEATAALLMLNTDRRGTNSSANGRGMSVKDLLTT